MILVGEEVGRGLGYGGACGMKGWCREVVELGGDGLEVGMERVGRGWGSEGE